MTDLADFFDEIGDALSEPIPTDLDNAEPLAIEHDDRANRLLHARAKILRTMREAGEAADLELERIQAWRADRLHGMQRQVEWLDTQLESYARARHKDGGSATLNLPGGKLVLTKQRERTEIVDVANVDEIEQITPTIVTTTKRVTATSVNEALEAETLTVGSLVGHDDEGRERWSIVDPETGTIVPGVYKIVVNDKTPKTFKVGGQ